MKKRISFQKLIDEKYDLVTRLEVLNWVLKTGLPYQESFGWERFGVDKWIFGYGANNHKSHTNLLPRICMSLQIGFVRAVVKTPTVDCVSQWKSDNSIFLNKSRMIELNDTVVSPKDRYQPRLGRCTWEPYEVPQLWALRGFIGIPLKKEFFQPDFPERTKPHFISYALSTAGSGFRLELRYTFENTSLSHWSTYFYQNNDESLDQFINKALISLDSLLLLP